jgi:formylglycine-generating enzyme required for sulfatase activity
MMNRTMVSVPRTRFRVGLTPDEADRLALELARMEEASTEDDAGFGGFGGFDVEAVRARRREWLEAAMPAHEVEVGPFEIDVYPVTNREWLRYAARTGAKKPALVGPDMHFVTGVSWEEARGFAQHHGLDLPSEFEWECAARNDRSFFTWGDSYFPQGEVAFRPPVLDPYAVGSRPELVSARGVHDLLGQFGEYCVNKLAPYPGADVAAFEKLFPSWRGQRVVRGGYDINQDATCVSRRGVPQSERRTHLKFRCVRREV